MPVPSNQERNVEELYPRSAIEKLLGYDEGNRRPKTLLKNARLALALGVMENHADRFQKTLNRLNAGEYSGAFTPESWRSLHQKWMENFGSVEGFLTLAATGMLRQKVQSAERKESSIGPEHD